MTVWSRRFTSPPWYAQEEAHQSGDWIEVAQCRAPWTGSSVLRINLRDRAAISVHRRVAMEAIPLGSRVEFDEDGHVWLAKGDHE